MKADLFDLRRSVHQSSARSVEFQERLFSTEQLNVYKRLKRETISQISFKEI